MRRWVNCCLVAVAGCVLLPAASGCGPLPGGASARCTVDYNYFNVEASGDKAAVDAFCKGQRTIDKPQGDKVCSHDIGRAGSKFTVTVYVRPEADQVSHDTANRLCNTYAGMGGH